MSSNANINTEYINSLTSESDRHRQKLSVILLNQLMHNNNNPNRPINYQSFSSNHPGYLDTEKKTRLVSIVRSSSIADQYRYGSSVTNFYIKNSYRYPTVTPEIIGTVIEVESRS